MNVVIDTIKMDSTVIKIKEIIKGFDEEIASYEKAIVTADDHLKFLKGNVAGLRRAKDTLEIFFQKQLEDEKNG